MTNQLNTSDFQAPRKFKEYEMYFLKKPITFTFLEPVILSKTIYAYKLSTVSPNDERRLKSQLKVINPAIDLKTTEFYINGYDATFYDQFKIEIKPLQSGESLFFVDVSIRGYKINANGNIFPIWSLLKAESCFQ